MVRNSARAGFTLVELLLIIAIIALLLALLGTSCYNRISPPSWYTVPAPPNVQTPTVTLAPGPVLLGPGSETTFTVTITYPQPIATDAGWSVFFAVYEDDTWPYGNRELIRRVPVSFPANATSGTATFTLKCVDENGALILQGADGSDEFESVWHVFARVEDQTTSDDGDSSNVEIRCASD